jgi:catechol 2,3-dioxygenase-like lactoylglutathione lyase family enzyme
MITGVQDIYYNVSNMDKAVEFYTNVLGMKLKHKDQWWSALDCGGVSVGLHWTEGSAVPEIPQDSHGANTGATLTLRSNDVASDRRHLEKNGAMILGEANQPWGHMLVFKDPDGNILKLMAPK